MVACEPQLCHIWEEGKTQQVHDVEWTLQCRQLSPAKEPPSPSRDGLNGQVRLFLQRLRPNDNRRASTQGGAQA